MVTQWDPQALACYGSLTVVTFWISLMPLQRYFKKNQDRMILEEERQGKQEYFFPLAALVYFLLLLTRSTRLPCTKDSKKLIY